MIWLTYVLKKTTPSLYQNPICTAHSIRLHFSLIASVNLHTSLATFGKTVHMDYHTPTGITMIQVDILQTAGAADFTIYGGYEAGTALQYGSTLCP